MVVAVCSTKQRFMTFLTVHYSEVSEVVKYHREVLKNSITIFSMLCVINASNIFERKVYRRILGPVHDNEKENWRILTNKEIYARVKKPTIVETIRLNRLRWFGHVQRIEENRIPKGVLYMNLETTRLRGRPRNR